MDRARAEDADLLTIRQALASFSSATTDTIAGVESAVSQALSSFQDEIRDRERIVEDFRDWHERAQSELSSCLSQQDDEGEPNCTYYEQQVQNAWEACVTAQKELQRAINIMRRVESSVENYRRHKLRVNCLISDGVSAAKAFLSQKATEIEDYDRVSIYNSSADGNASEIADSSTLSGDKSIVPLGEQGIVYVNVSDLPDPDDIKDDSDFSKTSMSRMKDGFRKLQKMMPVIQSNEGSKGEYWFSKDQKWELSYEQGYQRVYEAFYGSEPIRLEKRGDNYSIINGRHRIMVAKQMGIKTIPADIVIVK
ncbi:MAG: hypothetical protein GY795_41435 [Desulfobacterales bacterium]|nr:hypothetical protein [Desulfobacterales bacterium]